ncbi:MAG: hypothetical protein WC373_16625, partial [Smithella sp.]
MNKINLLQKELTEWEEKYCEAQADHDDALKRSREAERMCRKLGEQIEEMKDEENKKLIEIVSDMATRELDFYTALVKASLFTSSDPNRMSLQYIATTGNQVIASDGFGAYIATVEIPNERKNTFVKFNEVNDILEKKEPLSANISDDASDKKYFNAVVASLT